MSSIGEAREQILAVSASSDDALAALQLLGEAIGKAETFLKSAAGDTGHPKVEAALESYRVVTEDLAEVTNSVSAGQAAADGYVEILG